MGGPLILHLATYKGKICRILTKLGKKENQSLNSKKKFVIQHPFKSKSLVIETFIHFHGDPEILSEGLSESSYWIIFTLKCKLYSIKIL